MKVILNPQSLQKFFMNPKKHDWKYLLETESYTLLHYHFYLIVKEEKKNNFQMPNMMSLIVLPIIIPNNKLFRVHLNDVQ